MRNSTASEGCAAAALLLLAAGISGAWAHGSFHARIELAAQRIAADPGDIQARVARAVLYVNHGQWSEAEADFRAAEQLDPKSDALALAWGRALVLRGRHAEAVARLSGVLERHPGHAAGLAARGEALLALGRAVQAADDFDRAVGAAAEPWPDLYLLRARAAAAAGDTARALAGLEQGLRRLGPVVNLELAAIELQAANGDVDGALARIEARIASAHRPETWLARKGDVLAGAGRRAEARAAYRAALDALAALPGRLRNVPAMQALEGKLRGELNGAE